MAKKNRTFNIDGNLIEVSPEEAEVFIKNVPDAVEVEPYVIGKDTIGVALNEVEQFKANVPDAKPLFAEETVIAEAPEGQKKSPVGTSAEATGGFGESVAAKLEPFLAPSKRAIGMATDWVKSLFEPEKEQPAVKKEVVTAGPKKIQVSKFDADAITKSIAETPEKLRDSKDFKISWVNNYSKKTGIDRRAVLDLYDKANNARKSIDQLETEYYGQGYTVGEDLTRPEIPVGQLQKGDPMERFKKLYELAGMYNYIGDHDRAERAYSELEQGLYTYGLDKLEDPNFKARAPKNYIEQLQAPATQGLAYTSYLKGDKAKAKKIVDILKSKDLLYGDVSDLTQQLASKEKELKQKGVKDFQNDPEYKRIKNKIETRQDISMLPQVGSGELLQQPTVEKPSKGGGRLTPEQEYIRSIHDMIENVVLFKWLLEPAGETFFHGVEKLGKGVKTLAQTQAEAMWMGRPKEVIKKDIESVLNMTVGTAETAMGLASLTPTGLAYSAPIFYAQAVAPQATEYLMPFSKLAKDYYAEKGKEVPSIMENAAAAGDFALAALAHLGVSKSIGYAKAYGPSRKLDAFFKDLPPETVDYAFSQVEKNWKASGQDPVIYAEKIKEKANTVKQEAEGLQTDLKAAEPAKEYKPEPAPETLGQLTEGTEVEYQGQMGVLERGEDMSWNVNMGDGKIIELPVKDKTNATEKLVDLGINILPEVPKEQIAKAMADAEQVGKVQYKEKEYFVSLDRMNNPTPNGDFVLQIMPDGSMVDRFTSHQDPHFAAGRKLAITNAFLESKGLPKRSKNIEPWKESERIETPEGIITFEPETPNAAGGKGQYVLYDNLGEAKVITEQEFNRLKEMKPTEEVKAEVTPEAKPEAKPAIGERVTLEAKAEGGEPVKMVFTEEGWKKDVNGKQVKVGTNVQEMANEAWSQAPKPEAAPEAPALEAPKVEAPAAEAKPELTPEEIAAKELTPELEELGNRQVEEKGKGDWRQEFNKEKDPFRKASILRAIAESSKNIEELNDIKEAAKGMPEESNILNEVNNKLKSLGEEAPRAEEAPGVTPEAEAPQPIYGEGLKNALDKLKEAREKYKASREKLGVAFDPKQQAQDLYDLHQAFKNVAKEAIKEGVRKVEEFVKLFPAMTKGAVMAFEEALGIKNKLTVEDFQNARTVKSYNEPFEYKGKSIEESIKEATEMPIGKDYKDLVVRIKAEVKAAKEGFKAGKGVGRTEGRLRKEARNKEFAKKVNEKLQELKLKLDSKTIKKIVEKALKATNQKGLRSFEKFADKAIMRANYLADLDKANTLRDKLKSMIKGAKTKERLGANNVAIIDQFSKIRPEDLEDFSTYTDIAERLIESNKSMQYDKVLGGVKRAERVIANEEVANFLAEHQNKVEAEARQEIVNEYQDLVDMGIIDPGTMTSNDMLSIIDSIENTEVPLTDELIAQAFDRQIAEIAARQGLTPEMENKRLALGEKVLKAFQDAAKYSQMNLEKYFVEEAPALTTRQKETINNLMDIDTSKLSKDQALLVNRTIQNIINNNSFAGADQVAGVISFNQKAVIAAKEILAGKTVKEIGTLTKVAASKDAMIEKVTQSVENAAKLKRASGIEQMWNAVSKMENRFHDFFDSPKKSDSYVSLRDKLTKRDKVDYNSIRNRAIRGMYAKMIKNFGGTELEMSQEFMRHKRQVYENIKAYLSAGGEVKLDSMGYIREDANGRPVFDETVTPSKRTLRLRQEGELLFEIYNELFKDAKNGFDLQRNILKDGKGNVELVERAIEINKEFENDFFESAEMDQNKIDLDHQNNYTRDKYKSSIDMPLNREDTAEKLFNTVYSPRNVKDKMTGSMNKVLRTDKSYKGRLLNFDFDRVFRDALHQDMFATATSKHINQLKELFRTGDANKVFGNEANARAIKDMLVRAIDIQRNEHAPASELDRLIYKNLAGAAADAGRLALLGVFQLPKQFFGVAFGGLLTNGPTQSPRMLRYFAKGFANMNHPMLNEFNISQRGTIKGGFFEAPSSVITEKGLVKKDLYDKVTDFRKTVNEALGQPLGKGDAGVARSAWWMHYLDYLHKQGVDVEAIDFSTITPDYDAAAYAEQMTSRLQNANDRASMPQLYTGGNAFAKLTRDLVMPFSSFGLNQNRRMANDIDRIIHGPKEERKQAYNAFLSTAVEQFVFNSMKVYLLGNMTSTGAELVLDYFDVDDEEKNKYKNAVYADEKRSMTDKVIWNSIEDFTMSGIPFAVRTPIKQAFNYSYNALAGTDVNDKFNKGPFFIYQNTQDPDKPAWFEYMGLYGSVLNQGYDLYDLTDETFMGTTEGYGGVPVPLTQGERRIAQASFLISAAGLVGFSDQDITILNSKVKRGYRKHLLGTYGGEVQIKVGKKPTTSASFLRAKQDPKERAEVFLKVWNSPDITEEDKLNLIKQGLEDERTFTTNFGIELKKADRKVYNRYLILKRQAKRMKD